MVGYRTEYCTELPGFGVRTSETVGFWFRLPVDVRATRPFERESPQEFCIV